MIGSKLAHYQITSHLGSGGMGDVYHATDSKLGRSVAIKFLPEAFSHDTERVARFDREARVLASLNHPNIAAGTPVALFRTRIVGGGTDVNVGIQYDVARDGRFLINTVLDDAASPITLLMNWKPPVK